MRNKNVVPEGSTKVTLTATEGHWESSLAITVYSPGPNESSWSSEVKSPLLTYNIIINNICRANHSMLHTEKVYPPLPPVADIVRAPELPPIQDEFVATTLTTTTSK